MKSLLLLAFIVACGQSGEKGSKGTPGKEGAPGPSGANCYDYLEDVNADGIVDVKDCTGTKGEQGEAGVDGVDGSDGVDGVDGKDGIDGKDYVAPVSLEGYYLFPNGGYLELIENADKRIVIYGTQRLYTVNFDTGLALHPKLSGGPHLVKNGIINGEYRPNYSSTTNDVEVDGLPSTNISGSRKTVYKLWLTSNGKLKVQFLVYSSSGLSIDVNRTITGSK